MVPVQALLLARLEARAQAGVGEGSPQETPLWGWVPEAIYTLIKQCAILHTSCSQLTSPSVCFRMLACAQCLRACWTSLSLIAGAIAHI